MPKGEVICEGCGQYESTCFCDKPGKAEQELRASLKHILVEELIPWVHKSELDDWAKANGYVKLADDQALPKSYEGNRPRAKAFRDMIEAGWRKVKQG